MLASEGVNETVAQEEPPKGLPLLKREASTSLVTLHRRRSFERVFGQIAHTFRRRMGPFEGPQLLSEAGGAQLR